MSKSFAKHNKMKCASNVSDKLARSKANRKLRRLTKVLLKIGKDFFPLLREVSDPWDFPSDGLSHYFPIKGTKWERR